MYINFIAAEELYDLTPTEVIYILLVRQSVSEKRCGEYLKDLEVNKSKLLQYIDLNKKGELRLSKKGIEVLENLKSYKSDKDDIVIADYLAKEYTKLDKQVGNKKQLIENIAHFRKHSSLSSKGIFVLIQEFLKDDTLLTYSQRADYLISKPQRFENKFDINGSMLYQFYLRNRERINELIESIEA